MCIYSVTNLTIYDLSIIHFPALIFTFIPLLLTLHFISSSLFSFMNCVLYEYITNLRTDRFIHDCMHHTLGLMIILQQKCRRTSKRLYYLSHNCLNDCLNWAKIIVFLKLLQLCALENRAN